MAYPYIKSSARLVGAPATGLVGALALSMLIAPTVHADGLKSSSPTLSAPDTPGGGASTDDSEAAEVAKKLNNPVAALISVPLQNNWDYGIGTTNAERYQLNFQPVIPLSISKEWNVVVRTIVPIISAESPVPGGSSASGLGDIVQSFFFSPKEPTKSGWILAAGPVLLYPSATDSTLGSGKWGAGPTVVALKQEHGFTYGILANQIWSYAGWGTKDVNALFLQPFLTYTTKTHTSVGVNTESTYDWTASQWNVPINVFATQVLKIHKQIFSFTFGYRCYATTPAGGPNHGLRAVLTLVFPKK